MSLSPDVLDTLIFYGEDIAGLLNYKAKCSQLEKVYYFKKTVDEDQFDDMLKMFKQFCNQLTKFTKGNNSMHLAKVVEALEGRIVGDGKESI